MVLRPQQLDGRDALLGRPAQPVREIPGGFPALPQGELSDPLFDHGEMVLFESIKNK
jgi:hypothetical protein